MNKYIILSNKKRRHYKTTFNEKTNTYNNNLFCVNIDAEGDLSFPLLFSRTLDSEKNEGSIAFTPDQKRIYYTKENPNNHNVLELYTAELDLNSIEYWINIKKVKLLTGNQSIETPFVAPDGKTLYFAANLPTGYGGFDIYKADINNDGTFSNITNLGPNVNTAEDEKYPYISDESNHFYFASKGHLNLGGYDIFRSAMVNNSYLPALNLGASLNSKRDDIAFILTDKDKGYISNDKSGDGDFNILKFTLNLNEVKDQDFTIVEEETLTTVPNAKIIITDENGNVVTNTVSDENGKVKFEILPMSYNNITIEKEGFEPYVNSFTSEKPLNNPITLIIKKSPSEINLLVENIHFDFDKAVIKQESKKGLDKVVTLLNENPNLKLSIQAHTDNKGTESYNMALSKRRAKATANYLISKGINKNRLTTKGYGESQPLNNCIKCSPEED
jgi:outer membrane protein OmpA-like peptidoglycan-associated protein